MSTTRFWNELFANGTSRLDAAVLASEVPESHPLPGSLTRVAIERLMAESRAHREQHELLSRELRRLHAVVTVLAQALIDQGVADESELRWQIQDALRTVDPPSMPPPPPEAGGVPYRGTGAKGSGRVSEVIPRVGCAGCHQDVLVSTTIVTEEGTLCDDCFRTMQLATIP